MPQPLPGRLRMEMAPPALALAHRSSSLLAGRYGARLARQAGGSGGFRRRTTIPRWTRDRSEQIERFASTTTSGVTVRRQWRAMAPDVAATAPGTGW